MANLDITYQDMSDTATRLRNNKTDIDDKLNDCKNIVNSLTENGFVTDQSSGHFDSVHTDFVNSANEAMNTLDQLSTWLDKAVEAMKEMDSQLNSSLNK